MDQNDTPADAATGNGGQTPGLHGQPEDPAQSTTGEQADRVLTPEQKRELTIDTMASWALDGLHPTPEIVERINAYLRGEVTSEEYLRELKESFRTETDPSTPATAAATQHREP